jgi:death on curing protein
VTKFLSTEILREQLEAIGFVVRDHGLFASCVERAAVTLYGQDAYPSLEHKAAAILESFVKNHPMIDGNKRSGWLSANMFLDINGVDVDCSHDDAFDFILGIATSKHEFDDIVGWLSARTKTLPHQKRHPLA